MANRLANLPHLSRADRSASAIPCKICNGPALFFDVVDFYKSAGGYQFGPSNVLVPWHRCTNCGFLFTPFCDDWSQADFERFIYNNDYIVVDPDYVSLRPMEAANEMAERLAEFKAARILDYGAGSGLFARRMLEHGFGHVESYDPFSMPDRATGPFDIITCIEVLEHTPSPRLAVEDMASMLAPEGIILFSQSLQPSNILDVLCSWHYAAPRNGHVSTFTDRSLVALAEKIGLIYHRGQLAPHVLRKPEDGPLAGLAARFGPAMSSYRLGAPGISMPGWNDVERPPGDAFQWTAQRSLSWRVTVPRGPSRTVKVVIPFLHQSRRGFAGECEIRIADQKIPAQIGESSIMAEAGNISPGDHIVQLLTPELKVYPNTSVGLAVAVVNVSVAAECIAYVPGFSAPAA